VGERQTIVIAGAGIGGLTAALAIAARGFPVIVCERARQLSEIGAGLQLSPNAGRVLAALGLGEAVAAAAVEPEAIEIRAGRTGRLIAAIDLGALRRRHGIPWRVIHRAQLQLILARAVVGNPAIELRLGASVAGFAMQSGGIVARIERSGGSEVVEGAALIAADGVWSRSRIAIGGSPARPTGRVAWRAMIPAAAAQVPPNRIGLWLGEDAHLVHYPVAGASQLNVVAIVEEDWHGEGWSEPGDPYRLSSRFGKWSDEARAIIDTGVEWRRWAICAVDAAGPMVQDCVALLGDAAHAMPPFLAQGAAMAMEDAAAIAHWLGTIAHIPTALGAYRADRRARTASAAAAAEQTGRLYHLGGLAAAARDAALRTVGQRLIVSRNDWIYRWRPAQ
jgi:salicylate hydroxylase